MLIEIHVPRPLTLLLFIFAVSGWLLWLNGAPISTGTASVNQSSSSSTSVHSSLPVGGNIEESRQQVVEAEQEIFFARKVHATLQQKEELLRFQLKILEEERNALGENISSQTERSFIDARANLVQLLQDKDLAEQRIKRALDQLWDARVQGSQISILATGVMPELEWPVEPVYGVSATFRDPEYEEIFGFAHDGLDIPVLQNTPILAPAAGTVEKVADNGFGYSYIILRHAGVATLYGHVSQIDVAEGQTVSLGQQIGLSGGRPGTKGAGSHTTGPHLHLEVIKNGERIDPKTVLKQRSDIY